MKTLLAFVVGVLVGIAATWFVPQLQRSADRTGSSEAPDVSITPSKERTTSDQIKEELARSGRIVREKATKAGEAISDATANARITAAIKTKLLQDSGLSALRIDVDTTAGVVTLSGAVSSAEQITRAIDLALETEGVHKVISTLQLKPN